jgi:hypothetical protein
MSENHKSASPSAIHVKNRQKTVCIGEKLHVTSRLEKSERIVDICHNAKLAHSRVRTVRYNTNRIEERAKSRTKMFVCVGRLSQSYPNEPYRKLWM